MKEVERTAVYRERELNQEMHERERSGKELIQIISLNRQTMKTLRHNARNTGEDVR